MPNPTKPGVDWAEIERRYRAGESATALEKAFPVSRQGITKRARREGWQPSKESYLPATRQTVTAQRIAQPRNRSDQLLAAFGKRTPENAAQILECIELGMTLERSSAMVGISEDTFRRWRQEDADFAAQCEAARKRFEQRNLKAIDSAAQRGDARAAQWALQHSPHTRDTWGGSDAGSGKGGITVVINVPRGNEPIDVTPNVIEGSVT